MLQDDKTQFRPVSRRADSEPRHDLRTALSTENEAALSSLPHRSWAIKQMTFRLHNCAGGVPRKTPARIGVHFARYLCRYLAARVRHGKSGQF